MLTPEPTATPYDITSIPVFAYVPSAALWALVVGFGAAAVLFGFLLARGRSLATQRVNAYQLLLGEIAALHAIVRRAASIDKDAGSRVSALLRRYITLCGNATVWQLSPDELKRSLASIQSPPLKELLASIVQLETVKYAPPGYIAIPAALLNEIELQLRAYEDEISRPKPGRRRRAP